MSTLTARCTVCSKYFEAHRSDAMYCSKSHKTIAWRRRRTATISASATASLHTDLTALAADVPALAAVTADIQRLFASALASVLGPTNSTFPLARTPRPSTTEEEG